MPWLQCGFLLALVEDEFSQQRASLEHALAVRAMYGRYRAHGLARDVQHGLAVKRTGVFRPLRGQTLASQAVVVIGELEERYPFSLLGRLMNGPLRSQV